MSEKIEIIIIRAGEQIGTVEILESQWEKINYIDYIELNEAGEILPEFYEVHSNAVHAVETLLQKFNSEQKGIPTDKASRAARWQEFLQLKSLPFWNKEQEARYCWLFKQRKIDNRIAFNEDYKQTKEA